MRYVGHVKIEVSHFYPEEFRRKIDAEKYSKGTCKVSLELDAVEIEVTYRIDHTPTTSNNSLNRIENIKAWEVRILEILALRI